MSKNICDIIIVFESIFKMCGQTSGNDQEILKYGDIFVPYLLMEFSSCPLTSVVRVGQFSVLFQVQGKSLIYRSSG